MQGGKEKKNRAFKNRGFTLVELIVVLTIMAILLGLGGWALLGWTTHAQYIKDEESARTIYLAAQSALSAKDGNALLDEEMALIKKEAATYNPQITQETKASYGLPTNTDDELTDHSFVYLKVNRGDYSDDTKRNESELFSLIKPYITDTSILNGSIVIEFDITSQNVYSVFYSGWASDFEYNTAGTGSGRGTYYINSNARAVSVREPEVVGYYATDQVNVATLSAVKLRMTGCVLNNEETLNLQFGSNSKFQELDTQYTLSFYEDKGDNAKSTESNETLLFTAELTYQDILNNLTPYSTDKLKIAWVPLTLKKAGSSTDTETQYFLITFDGTNYDLVLDAQMSSQMMAVISLNPSGSSSTSMSITKLSKTGTTPKNIYVRASVAANSRVPASREYIYGKSVTTSTENDMFSTPSSISSYTPVKSEISLNRHFSNIRFYQNGTAEAPLTFTLKKDINWSSSELYDDTAGSVKPYEVAASSAEFPTITSLDGSCTIDGAGKTYKNLVLGYHSSVDYTGAAVGTNYSVYGNKAVNLAVIGINKGTVTSLAFDNARLVTDTALADNAIKPVSLKTCGILCGVDAGNVKLVKFNSNCSVTASVSYNETTTAKNASGIGMMCGVLKLTSDTESTLTTDRIITNGTVNGTVSLPSGTSVDFTIDTITGKGTNDAYKYIGIGGVCGFLYVDKPAASVSYTRKIGAVSSKLTAATSETSSWFSKTGTKSIVNYANVTGTMFTGGIVGNAYTNIGSGASAADANTPQIINCYNEGMILAAGNPDLSTENANNYEKDQAKFNTLTGFFIGGICGYNYQSSISSCSDTTSKAKAAAYTGNDAKNNLKKDSIGFFVGGITGFSEAGYIYNCNTTSGGYVLGYDYVGGIAGSLKGSQTGISQIAAGTSAVTNACYVIGHSFVGGIIGINNAGSTISDCINKGIAAGDGIDIGGIAGKNRGTVGSLAVINNCSGSFNDYGNTQFNLIKTTWGLLGSNVGGLVGYNEYGSVTYKYESGTLAASNSVSSVAVGYNNVGGVIGFNGAHGSVSLNFASGASSSGYISGKVFGAGDCVGGFIGLNLSPSVFTGDAFNVSTAAVDGRYCVGGTIGANLVEGASKDVSMTLRYVNSVSKITGTSLVGGLIGYNEMVTKIVSAAGSDTALTDSDALGNTSWYTKFLVKDNSGLFSSASNVTADATNIFIIGDSASTTSTVFNNAGVSAVTLGGGLLGMNSPDSGMIIINSTNSGSLTELSPSGAAKINIGTLIGNSSVTDQTALLGGIVSYNTQRCVIDNCINTGTMDVKTGGFGGIVGLNNGYILNCTLSANLGRSTLNYIGGIAAINYNKDTAAGSQTVGKYSYTAGTISACTTGKYTITGLDNVGGIAGYNYTENAAYGSAVIMGCSMNSNVSGDKNVGGLTGDNSGKLTLSGTVGSDTSSLTISGKNNVGGIAGKNEGSGVINCSAEIKATGSGLSVKASGDNAGGIVGYMTAGNITGTADGSIKSYATVNAGGNYAGGIVGNMAAGGTISYTENYGSVQASAGYAGGITAYNAASGTKVSTISNSVDYGNVTSTTGYAAGIASENEGIIDSCSVVSAGGNNITTLFSSASAAGVISSINKGTVSNCISGIASSTSYVLISDSIGTMIGGFVGQNNGIVYGGQVNSGLSYKTNMSSIMLGGAVGNNSANGLIGNDGVHTSVDLDFNSFTGVQYLGGISGQNLGTVKNCSYSGLINEGTAAIGNSYGGITGINGDGSTAAVITNCYVSGITMTVNGTCALDPSQSAQDKLDSTSFTGGIAGKNSRSSKIQNCYIFGSGNTITAKQGMIGGITGANAGTLVYCGYSDSMKIVDSVYTALSTNTNDSKNALTKLLGGSTYSSLKGSDTSYDLKVEMTDSGYGYLGGVTGFNSTNGSVIECATGKWYIHGYNIVQNAVIGGVVGQNESEKTVQYNVNCAYVKRYIWVSGYEENSASRNNRGTDKYYVGGVIGEQQNRTSGGWVIDSCVNYGAVEDENSHNSGGIIARWRNNGGTVSNCFNYGVLYTNMQAASQGTVGGIIGFINEMTNGQDVNILSCQNHGIVNQPIYYSTTAANNYCANDCAGILAEVNTQGVTETVKINLSDCVNGSDATVFAFSMADGIVSWLGGTGGSIDNIILNINRCRNYSTNLISFQNSNSSNGGYGRTGGIFGTRADYSDAATAVGYTSITNCFSVYYNSNTSNGSNPIAWAQEGVGEGAFKYCYNNYYLDSYSFNSSNCVGSLPEAKASNTVTIKTGGNPAEANHSSKINAQRLYAGTDSSQTSNSVTKFFAALPNNSTTMSTLKAGSAWVDTSANALKSNKDSSTVGYTYLWFGDGYYTSGGLYQGKNSGLDYTDVIDEAIQAYYSKYLDNANFSAPTNVAVTKSEGNFMVTWDDAVNSNKVQYYDLDALVYQVPKNAVFTYNYTTNTASYVPAAGGNSVSVSVYKDINSYVYQKNGTFSMDSAWETDGFDYYFVVRVKAQGSNDTVNANSAWGYASAPVKGQKVLPTPDLELVRIKSTWYLRLLNVSDYSGISGWSVSAHILNKSTVYTLNSDNIQVKFTDGLISNVPLRASASPSSADADHMTSLLFSSNIYVPQDYYPASGSLTVSSSAFSGTTVNDLSYSVTLKYTSSVGYPQTFRVEIYGKDNNTSQSVTLAYKDVSLAKGVSTAVTIESLPSDLLTNYSNIKVAIWHASTGLGPVYQYYEVTKDEMDAACGTSDPRTLGYEVCLDGLDSDGNAVYSYYYSNPIYYSNQKTNSYSAGNHYYSPSTSVALLAAPVLQDSLTGDTGSGNLTYDFIWDSGVKNSDTYNYTVELYGLTLSDPSDPSSSVISKTLLTTGYSSPGNTFNMNADSWTYDAVQLSVTRVGGNETTSSGITYHNIGQTSTGIYLISERLPQIQQPTLTLKSTDGLMYDISWVGDTENAACTGYDVYIDYTKESTVEKVLLGSTSSKDVTELDNIDFDDYAGDYAEIYVVARADSGQTKYLDSADGIRYTMTVLNRLAQPKAAFKWNIDAWNSTDATKRISSESDFTAEGSRLLANITSGTKLDGSYLVGGLLYDTEADAQNAITDITKDSSGNALASTDQTYSRIVMANIAALANNSTLVDKTQAVTNIFSFGFGDTKKIADDDGSQVSPYEYSLGINNFSEGTNEWSMKYAGKYMVPFTRATDNTDISSIDAWNLTPLALPMVKFDAPVINVSQTNETVTGHSYKLANYQYPDQVLSSNMALDTYSWSRGDTYADSYQTVMTATQNELQSDFTVAAKNVTWPLSISADTDNNYLDVTLGDRDTSGSYITDTNGKYSFKTADTILAESVKVETAIASAKVTATKTDTDGSVYTVYQCTDGTTYYTVKTETKTTDYATETYMTYYDGQNTATPINPADVSGLTFEYMKMVSAPLTGSSDPVYAAYYDRTDKNSPCLVRSAITSNAASLLIPGSENCIAGQTIFGGSYYTHYLFTRRLEVTYKQDGTNYDYSVIAPSTSNSFNFNIVGDDGTTYTASVENYTPYAADADYYTCAASGSTQFVTSDATNVKVS